MVLMRPVDIWECSIIIYHFLFVYFFFVIWANLQENAFGPDRTEPTDKCNNPIFRFSMNKQCIFNRINVFRVLFICCILFCWINYGFEVVFFMVTELLFNVWFFLFVFFFYVLILFFFLKAFHNLTILLF